MNKVSGVYRITNTVTGKHYVGSAVVMRRRWWRHRYDLKRGASKCRKLQAAWNEYGEESFEFAVVLVCEIRDLLVYEQICIDFFGAASGGYNICPTAGSSRGMKTSEETKRKLSDASKKASTPEMRALISARNTGFVQSPETRAKVSASAQARSAETSLKMKAIWAARKAQKEASNEPR